MKVLGPLVLPHRTAPGSPADGELWTTTTGLFVRINGATVGPLSTGGGGSATPGWTTTATGTGTSQDVTLPESGLTVNDVFVFVRGVFQRPTTDYTIVGATLTLTSYASGDSITIIKPATNPSILGWDGGIDGLMADAETINLGFAPKAINLTTANCQVWALTGATASTVLTLWKKTSVGATPVQILTATFAAGGSGGAQAATISMTNAAIESGAMVYWTGPATADATLANIAYMIR